MARSLRSSDRSRLRSSARASQARTLIDVSAVSAKLPRGWPAGVLLACDADGIADGLGDGPANGIFALSLRDLRAYITTIKDLVDQPLFPILKDLLDSFDQRFCAWQTVAAWQGQLRLREMRHTRGQRALWARVCRMSRRRSCSCQTATVCAKKRRLRDRRHAESVGCRLQFRLRDRPHTAAESLGWRLQFRLRGRRYTHAGARRHIKHSQDTLVSDASSQENRVSDASAQDTLTRGAS